VRRANAAEVIVTQEFLVDLAPARNPAPADALPAASNRALHGSAVSPSLHHYLCRAMPATPIPRCWRPMAHDAVPTHAACCSAARCGTGSGSFCLRRPLSTVIIRATPSRFRRQRRSAGRTRPIGAAPLRFGRARSSPHLPSSDRPRSRERWGLPHGTARAWTAGERRPENLREVARAIVALARDAGLGLPSDDHLRAEEICAELPVRAAAVQCFTSVMVMSLAERCGGVRALARTMAGEGATDLEPTVRRWLALVGNEPRPIGELNRILARLAKFSRSEIRKTHRRSRTEPGAAGDRQAIVAHLSLGQGAEKPSVLTPEEMFALPIALAVAGLFVIVCQAISRIFEAAPRGTIRSGIKAPVAP
jgi:hypothetical protein